MAEGRDPGDNKDDQNCMTALFECGRCRHSWISVKSLGLPEECEKCKTEVSNPMIHRKATRQEQLFAKKLTMIAMYKCGGCHEKWRKRNSSGKPMACPTCGTSDVEPYKYLSETRAEPQRRRLFGHFRCSCGNEWKSGQAWEAMRQGCLKCKKMIHPYRTEQLKGGGGNFGKSPHLEALCEMCQKLGRNCKDYVIPDRDVSGGDGEASVLSFMTRSSESSGRRDDDTPRNSDSEPDLDDFENLKI